MEEAEIRRYDLTNRISQNLDLHMVYFLLQFLIEKKMYPEQDLQEAKLKLTNKTEMVDFAISLHQEIHGEDAEIPQEYTERRGQVFERIEALKELARPMLDIFQDSETVSKLTSDKQYNIRFLKDNFGFRPEHLDNLYRYAKNQYDCGDYAAASEMLYQFRVLATDEKSLSALWGKLASEILIGNWEVAVEDFTTLKQILDQRSSSSLEVLQQRTWLIHWGLFIYFNVPTGRDMILELLQHPMYRQTIQTSCPHFLRYLVAAVILVFRRKDSLKDVLTLVQQETYQYRDPLTEFVEALFVKHDFEEAQRQLIRCEKVMENDFFLEDYVADFSTNARRFIFETYCKIHQRIDLENLAQRLGIQKDEAEKWIVNLIRNAQLDAKIDSEKSAVMLTQRTQNIYQQVIEKTKPLAFRTNILITSIDKKNSPEGQGRPQKNYQQQRGGKRTFPPRK